MLYFTTKNFQRWSPNLNNCGLGVLPIQRMKVVENLHLISSGSWKFISFKIWNSRSTIFISSEYAISKHIALKIDPGRVQSNYDAFTRHLQFITIYLRFATNFYLRIKLKSSQIIASLFSNKFELVKTYLNLFNWWCDKIKLVYIAPLFANKFEPVENIMQ